MAHTFSITIPDDMDLKDGIEQVRSGVLEAGGKYSFDGKNGSVEVKGVHGTFVVVGRVVTITITKKPFIVSNGFVENTIRGYLV
jgi:hypothetical protein